MWRTERYVSPTRPGKKDCGIILYDRESGKKLHKIPFRREERMGNVYCKYLELDPQQIGYQFYEEERIVPDLHARGFLSKPVYGKTRKNCQSHCGISRR